MTIPTQTRNATWRRICSSAAGHPIRKIRLTVSKWTHSPRRCSCRRCLPRTRMTRRNSAPMTYEIDVPMAAPGTPSRGTTRFPKIRFTLIPKFTTFTRTPIHNGVTVSPAPRRAALPRKPMNWKNTTREMMRMYALPSATTSGAAPNPARMGSAKTNPTKVRGIDKIAPRTRLCFNTWSASWRSLAPIARETRAIVPADTLIMTLKKRKMNCPPKPTAATAAGASAPSAPTMMTSTVVVRVWSRFEIITGQASWKTDVGARFEDASAVAPAIRGTNHPALFVSWCGALADDLNDHFSLAGLVVQLEEHDLLPCPQLALAVDDRERQARPKEGRSDMTVAVAVVPPLLVPVRGSFGDEALHRIRDVLFHESRFELVRDDRARAARGEDAREAFANPGFRDRRFHSICDVDRLDATGRSDPNRFRMCDHGGENRGSRKKIPRAPSQPRLRLTHRAAPDEVRWPENKEVARAEPPPFGGAARSPRGWALVGGGLLSLLSAAR